MTTIKQNKINIKESRVIKAVFLTILALFVSLFLLSPPELINHTLIISLLPCSSACLIICRGEPDKTGRDLQTDIASFLLTALFLLMLSVSEIIRSPLFASSVILSIAYLVYLTGSVFITVQFSLRFFIPDRNRKRGDFPAGRDWRSERRIYRLMPLYVALGLLFLLANYPFRPSPDAMTVYNGIIEKSWSDWHPIGYVTFVRLCMLLASPITFHPFAACIVQTLFWFLIFHQVGLILYRCTGSARAVNMYRIVNLVIFVPFLYLGVMYKDVVYAMCILGFCAETYLFLCHKASGRKDFVLITLFSAGVSIFRHMGIVTTVVPLIVLAGYFFKKRDEKWKGLLLSAILTVFSFLAVTDFYGSGILNMQKNPDYVKYTVPLYLVGNLASGHPELFTGEDKALMEEMMPYEDWVAAYNLDTYWADNLARDSRIVGRRIYHVDEAYGREILKLNFRLLFRSPSSWMSALFRINSIIWQIGRPADGYEWTVAGYYVPEDRPDLIEHHLVTTEKAINQYLGDFQYFLEEQPPLSAIYYRGGIWAYLLLFLAFVLILKKRMVFLICLLPPALNTAMLMITCPSQDPRFVLPAMEIGMFFFPAVLYLKGAAEKESIGAMYR